MNKSNHRVLYAALGATLLMVLYAQFVLGYNSKCFSLDEGVDSIGLIFAYDAKDVLGFFSVRSYDQLSCYRKFLVLYDGIFPLLYTSMYILWFRFLFKSWRVLVILPLVHMFLDWSENYCEILMIDQYLTNEILNGNVVTIASAVSMSKWISSALTYFLIIFGAVHRVKRFFTLKRRDQ